MSKVVRTLLLAGSVSVTACASGSPTEPVVVVVHPYPADTAGTPGGLYIPPVNATPGPHGGLYIPPCC